MRRIKGRYPTVWNVLIDVGAAGLVVYMVVLMGLLRTTQVRVVDCTDPDGSCYQSAQQRTADAVASINEISVYAAACADRDGEQTALDIQRCVIERIKSKKETK